MKHEKHTLLVADDEDTVHKIIKGTFSPADYRILSVFDGKDVAEIARKENPDLILLDISMPHKSGKEVLLELRGDAKTRMTPVLILTGGHALSEVEGFKLGADDYVDKPFDLDVLRARVESILRRNKRFLAAHPLSHLPGSSAIEHEVRRRIRDGEHFALLYVDIDRFGDYNNAKGHDQGDKVLMDLADILRESLKAVGHGEGFLGHIAEDDFIALTDPGAEEKLAHYIIERFHEQVPELALCIGSTSTDIHDFKHHAKLMDIVKKFKAFLQNRQDHKESVYIKDRTRPKKT